MQFLGEALRFNPRAVVVPRPAWIAQDSAGLGVSARWLDTGIDQAHPITRPIPSVSEDEPDPAGLLCPIHEAQMRLAGLSIWCGPRV